MGEFGSRQHGLGILRSHLATARVELGATRSYRIEAHSGSPFRESELEGAVFTASELKVTGSHLCLRRGFHSIELKGAGFTASNARTQTSQH